MANILLNKGRKPTMVLRDTVINGDVSLPGELRLFGRVTGNVRSGSRMEVMKEAVVEGGVESEELYVEGTISGDVCARMLDVGDGAVLKGRVEAAFVRMRGRQYELRSVKLKRK